jgi:hypothetical protein
MSDKPTVEPSISDEYNIRAYFLGVHRRGIDEDGFAAPGRVFYIGLKRGYDLVQNGEGLKVEHCGLRRATFTRGVFVGVDEGNVLENTIVSETFGVQISIPHTAIKVTKLIN